MSKNQHEVCIWIMRSPKFYCRSAAHAPAHGTAPSPPPRQSGSSTLMYRVPHSKTTVTWYISIFIHPGTDGVSSSGAKGTSTLLPALYTSPDCLSLPSIEVAMLLCLLGARRLTRGTGSSTYPNKYFHARRLCALKWWCILLFIILMHRKKNYKISLKNQLPLQTKCCARQRFYRVGNAPILLYSVSVGYVGTISRGTAIPPEQIFYARLCIAGCILLFIIFNA
jgi:hypothetical protein